MTKLLSKEAEDRLLKAARDVTTLVDDEGHSPTDAAVKVAQQYGLGPEMVKRVCEAYNAGRLTYQRESHHDILDKMASFELASPERAISILYPTSALDSLKQKSAAARDAVVSAIYDHAPSGPRLDDVVAHRQYLDSIREPAVKAAAAPEATQTYSQKYAAYTKAGADRQLLELEYLESKDAFQYHVQRVAGYFKQASYDRLPYGAVAANAVLMFGTPGEAILGYLESRHGLNRIKEAADRKNPKHYCVDRTLEPYCSFGAAIKAAEETNRLQRLRIESDAALHKMAQAVGEAPAPAEEPKQEVKSVLSKKSNNLIMGALGGMMQNSLRGAAPQPKTTQDLVKDYEGQLTDPDHEDKLRTIRAKAMLTDFMANDDVISGYDPNEILEAYNSISQLAPRTSTQPAVIRPLLQKWLAQGGKIEPFEAAETANIENTIAKNQGMGGEGHGSAK